MKIFDIKKGSVFQYKEDDFVAEVKVIENKSNRAHYIFIIEILEVVLESRIYESTPVGEQVRISIQRKYADGYLGCWRAFPSGDMGKARFPQSRKNRGKKNLTNKT